MLTIIVDFFLEIWKFSIKEAIEVSIILIPDVIAAKKSNMKKITPKREGYGSLENISGSEIKTKEAPAAGSKPNENTIGKIITPARTAIKVSKKINV